MSTYVTVHGQRLAPAVARAFAEMDAAFFAVFDLRLRVTSGTRTRAEQEKLFFARYRVQAFGRGPYNDVRWYKGKRWVRHSSAGTVAVPGTSLHENDRAVDIRDTGDDAGVTVAGTERANWIRRNASRFGFAPNGYNFGEPWHIEYQRDPWAGVPSGGGGTVIPKPTPKTRRKRKNMTIGVFFTDDKADKNRTGVILDSATGNISRFGWFSKTYGHNVAKGYGLDQAGELTRAHFNRLINDFAARVAAGGKVTVDLSDDTIAVIKDGE